MEKNPMENAEDVWWKLKEESKRKETMAQSLTVFRAAAHILIIQKPEPVFLAHEEHIQTHFFLFVCAAWAGKDTQTQKSQAGPTWQKGFHIIIRVLM